MEAQSKRECGESKGVCKLQVFPFDFVRVGESMERVGRRVAKHRERLLLS